MEFDPIAERRFLLVFPDGREEEMYVAVGAPYFPAENEDVPEYAGCLVSISEEPNFPIEKNGIDKMEALISALQFVEAFFINLTIETGGTLRNLDGSQFNLLGSPMLREARVLFEKRKKRLVCSCSIERDWAGLPRPRPAHVGPVLAAHLARFGRVTCDRFDHFVAAHVESSDLANSFSIRVCDMGQGGQTAAPICPGISGLRHIRRHRRPSGNFWMSR